MDLTSGQTDAAEPVEMVMWDEGRGLGYEDEGKEDEDEHEDHMDEDEEEEYIEDDDDMRNARVRSTSPWTRRH